MGLMRSQSKSRYCKCCYELVDENSRRREERTWKQEASNEDFYENSEDDD